MNDRVGVRELRQNLSVYVRRVMAGERLVVTDRRRPVAVLAPLPADEDPLERLISDGRATRPVGDLLELAPGPGDAGDPRALTRALEEQRAERSG